MWVNYWYAFIYSPPYAIARYLFAKHIYNPLKRYRMKSGNRLLGIVAMMAAPFLFLQMMTGSKDNEYNSPLGGFFDLIYMVGWMCSVVGLLRLQTAGTKKSGHALFQIQLAFLCLANFWNIWVIFDPTNKSTLFFVLDMFWPLSNLCFLVIGIITAVTGKLRGWRRYVPLATGMWLPVTFCAMMLFGRSNLTCFIGGIYSTIAWFVLGWMIFTSEAEKVNELLPKYTPTHAIM